MKGLLLFCVLALLLAGLFGLQGNLETYEECEACTVEESRRGLCKPCSSNQNSGGKHSMYSSDQHTEDDYLRVPELRLVMIGHTGSGKSATANTILGMEAFRSQASAFGVTTRSQRGRALRFGRHIQIVDTPGLFDPKLNNTDVIREVVKCIGMVSPGPHAFLLVIPIGRFSQEHKDTVVEFEKYLGGTIMRYIIVVFTRTGDLDAPLSEYVKDVPEKLEELLKESQFRYIGFDNKATKQQKDAKVQELLSMIDKMIAANGGNCYTSEVFAAAEKKLKRREEEMRRQIELEKKEANEIIERKYQKKMDEDREQHKKEVERLNQHIQDLDDDDGRKSKIQELEEQMRKQREEMEEKLRKQEEEMEQLKSEKEKEYDHRQRGSRERIRRDIERGYIGMVWDALKGIYRFFFG